MSINTPFNVTLTEGQISTILFTMEGYMQGSDDNEDSQFVKDVDEIFEILEGAVDKYYNCLLYTSPSPRDVEESLMPSSA